VREESEENVILGYVIISMERLTVEWQKGFASNLLERLEIFPTTKSTQKFFLDS
jgi:hypothetical protein